MCAREWEAVDCCCSLFGFLKKIRKRRNHIFNFLHHRTTTWKPTRWPWNLQSYRSGHVLMKNRTCTTNTFIFSRGVKFIFSRVAPPMVREHSQCSRPQPRSPPPTPIPLRRRPPHSALHSLHALLITPPLLQLMAAPCISRHSFMPHRSHSHSCTCLHKLFISSHWRKLSFILSLVLFKCQLTHPLRPLAKKQRRRLKEINRKKKSYHQSIQHRKGGLHPWQVAILLHCSHRETTLHARTYRQIAANCTHMPAIKL